MKTDVRSSIALLLLAIGTTAVAPIAQAQDAQPPQPGVPPQPTQPQAPQPAVPAQNYPTQQAPQYVPPQATPAPGQYAPPQAPPAPAPYVPQQAAPAPPQYAPPQPTPAPAPSVPQSPPPPQYTPRGQVMPQSPPPPTYPTSPQYQYPATPPATPQQQPPPPPAQYGKPQWAHSESSYPDSGNNSNGFHYHPLRFHIDGGGTLTQKSNSQDFADGWNAGLGLTWYPTSILPLGLRIDGTYNEFNARTPLLAQVAAENGTGIYHGFQRMWGGDTDLELDLHLSPYVRAYLLAGGGWYKQETIFRNGYGYGNGYGCCGYFGTTVGRYDSDWHFARNAGAGLEFAMGPDASFFIEGRYMRLDPNDAKSDYIPIRAGLRF